MFSSHRQPSARMVLKCSSKTCFKYFTGDGNRMSLSPKCSVVRPWNNLTTPNPKARPLPLQPMAVDTIHSEKPCLACGLSSIFTDASEWCVSYETVTFRENFYRRRFLIIV